LRRRAKPGAFFLRLQIETSSRCEEVLAAPGGEELHDGAEGLAFGGKGIFDAGRDFGIGGAGDEAVLFEFFELAGEDFEGHTGDDAVDLAEAEGAVEEDIEDDGLPFAADDVDGGGDGAVGGGVISFLHGLETFFCGGGFLQAAPGEITTFLSLLDFQVTT